MTSFAFLEWSFFPIFFVWCLVFGYLWNLVVLSCMALLKIPVSRRVEILTYVPLGISLACAGIMLYFVIQALVVSVTGRGTVLFYDTEKTIRRIAIALGYSVRTGENKMAERNLLRKIREMARENG